MKNMEITARKPFWGVRLAHWFWGHTALRWTFIMLAGWTVVIALFYAEEDWRGKRDWARTLEATQAKGHDVTWRTPPEVRADENFFAAPNMQQWFTGRGGNSLSSRMGFQNFGHYLGERAQNSLADITIVPTSAKVPSDSADIVLLYKGTNAVMMLDDDQASKMYPSAATKRAATKQLDMLISTVVQTMTNGTAGQTCEAALGFELLASPLKNVKPVSVVVKSDDDLRSDQLASLFSSIRVKSGFSLAQVTVRSTGDHSFVALLEAPPFVAAADYIGWTDEFKPDLEAIHEALNRPYARMGGDYHDPPTIPIPNFVCARTMAQTLAQRTQSYLLLGEPEKAVREQLFIRDLCKMFEGRPTSKPMTLIAAMINVAVTGLYTQTFGDGLRMGAWREPQLAAIQEQLGKVDLESYVYSALEWESASHGQLLETTSSARFAELFSGNSNMQPTDKLKSPIYWYCFFAPRGWIYQNMARSVQLQGNALDGFDCANQTILPKVCDAAFQKTQRDFDHTSPYNYLASMFVPNYSRAILTMARNQTLVNEAYVVCGLERYRMAHGHYPQTLDELVPQFAEKIPSDMIGGGPLKYRVEGSKFALYSVGWNGTDEGGVPAWTNGVDGDLKQNDWVWPYAP